MARKVCTKCGKNKKSSVRYFYRSVTHRDGLYPSCKDCQRQAKQQSANWRNQGQRENKRDYHLKRTFGISAQQYQAIFNAQGGICAICSSPPSSGAWGRLVVDHNHATKKNRGLLCRRCNLALERLERDPSWGEKAVAYLAKYIEELVNG